MAELTRRLQVLIDDSRYERLRRESQRTGAPVSAIVRDAIDMKLPPDTDPDAVAAAARRLLDAEPMPVEGWDVMKSQMLDELS
jgi:predicted DNA-binding protein